MQTLLRLKTFLRKPCKSWTLISLKTFLRKPCKSWNIISLKTFLRKLCKSWTLISLKTFLRKLCKLLPSRICRKNNFIEFYPNPTIFVLSTVGFWSVLEPKTGPQDPKIKIFQNEKKPPEVFSQKTSVPIFSQIHQTLASLGRSEGFWSILGKKFSKK